MERELGARRPCERPSIPTHSHRTGLIHRLGVNDHGRPDRNGWEQNESVIMDVPFILLLFFLYLISIYFVHSFVNER